MGLLDRYTLRKYGLICSNNDGDDDDDDDDDENDDDDDDDDDDIHMQKPKSSMRHELRCKNT